MNVIVNVIANVIAIIIVIANVIAIGGKTYLIRLVMNVGVMNAVMSIVMILANGVEMIPGIVIATGVEIILLIVFAI